MAKLEHAHSSSYIYQPKKSKLTIFLHFFFFALGLSLGLTIGFFDLQSIPSTLSYSLANVSLSLPPQPAALVEAVNNMKDEEIALIPPVKSSYSLANVSQPPPPQPAALVEVVHSMSDNELILKASLIPQMEGNQLSSVAKVAFMFLTKGPLPLAPLWELFFKGHKSFYSIYIHTHPSYNESWSQDSVFYGRRVPSQEVHWGTISMIDAEKRLLANALLDYSNQRFVLISESCIPLFNFITIYTHLINSNLSNLGCFDDPRAPGRGRYNKRMFPNITIQQWRKGSQWFEVRRDLAMIMVLDQKYYSIFEEHCKPQCYNDEHYFPTLANIMFPKLISNVSITWVDWSKPGPHPGRFINRDITEEFLNRIRFGSNCTYNGNVTSMCFLFARKFVGDTLRPLLDIAPRLLGFDP